MVAANFRNCEFLCRIKGALLGFSTTGFANLREEDCSDHYTNLFILHDSFIYVQFVLNQSESVLPLLLPRIMSLFTQPYRQQLTYWGYS